VLVDMQTGDTVDLLPDREAATVEAWLKAHPGVAVICRDRAGAYAEGARDGAPGAIQGADRWHLWHNLAGYAGKTGARARACLTAPDHGDGGGTTGPDAARQDPGGQEGGGGEAAAPAGLALAGGLLDACGRERRLVVRTRERYAEIRQRTGAGGSLGAVRRAMGLA